MPIEINPNAIYKLEEAIRSSGFCKQTVIAALKAGKLIGSKTKGRWLILGADLQMWMIGKTTLQVANVENPVALRESVENVDTTDDTRGDISRRKRLAAPPPTNSRGRFCSKEGS